MATPTGNSAAAAAAAAGSVRAASCIKITGNGTYEIVPYQTAVDIYADANDTLITALEDNVEINNTYLQNAKTYLESAIVALESNISNPPTDVQTTVKNAAKTAINEVDSIINPAAPPAAPAPADPAAAKTRQVMLTEIGRILIGIAKILAPPTVRISISGGRRKRNTRHKHRKNKNKTRVGRR